MADSGWGTSEFFFTSFFIFCRVFFFFFFFLTSRVLRSFSLPARPCVPLFWSFPTVPLCPSSQFALKEIVKPFRPWRDLADGLSRRLEGLSRRNHDAVPPGLRRRFSLGRCRSQGKILDTIVDSLHLQPPSPAGKASRFESPRNHSFPRSFVSEHFLRFPVGRPHFQYLCGWALKELAQDSPETFLFASGLDSLLGGPPTLAVSAVDPPGGWASVILCSL